MAVTISNQDARYIWPNNGEYETSGWQSSYISTGFYNSAYTYVAELRFRLDKPCSSITISFNGAKNDGVGTIYWVVSDKELDEDLLDQIYASGSVPGAESVYISYSSYWGKNIGELTIEGAFPANTDLYIYGYRAASTSYNVIKLYGLYDSSRYSKVTSAVEIERWDVTYTYGGETVTDVKNYGEALTLRGVSFYRNGYTQIGWSTSEGGELTHKLGESYTADAALSLYPVWGVAPKAVLWLLLSRIGGVRNGG